MRLGRFRLSEALAAGAAGTVWRARHVSGHPAAVKLLHQLEHNVRFDAEVAAICELDHPNIVQVLDAGSVTSDEARADPRLRTGVRWLAMELVEGGTVQDHRHGAWPQRAEVLVGLLRALAHAHAAGLVHRDVKPPNLLWDGRVRLADFGIASPTGRPPDRVLGTPAFMAPEQLTRGARLGPWTDLYAAGLIGWWLATGTLPYPGQDARALMRAQLHAPLPAFQPRPDVPSELQDWIRWCAAKRPDARPRSAAQALEALPAIVRRPRSGPRPQAPAGAGLVALRRPPLVGRQHETHALDMVLAQCRIAGGPRAVVISGPAGIGKTRLATWFLRHARERGLAEGLTMGPERDRSLADAESRRGAGRPLSLDPDVAPQRLLRDLHAWAQGPVIVHLDDGGPQAQALADALLDAADVPALIIVTQRDPDLGALGGRPDVTSLPLAPLAADAAMALARSLLELADGTLRDVVETTAGSPQFLLQLVAHNAASGALEPGPWGHRLSHGRTLEIPQDLRGVCDALLLALPSETHEPVRLAALLGPDVGDQPWEQALAVAGHRVPQGLVDTLVRRQLARRTPSGWMFTHPLWCEVLASEAGPDLHAAAARVTRGSEQAKRLADAGAWDQAIDALEAAIRDAGEDGDLRRALLARLSQGFRATGRDTEDDAIHLELHEIRSLSVEGREDRALPRIRALLPRARAAGRTTTAIELTIQAGRAALDSGAPELARAQLAAALDLAEGSPTMRGWAAHQAAWAECVLGDPGAARRHVDLGLSSEPWPLLEAHLHAAGGYADALAGRDGAARDAVARARTQVHSLDLDQEVVRMDTHTVLIDTLAGDAPSALARAQRLLVACRIGRLRQHLLAMVCALSPRDPTQTFRAMRLARNARETFDVRHQASAVLHRLGRADEADRARLAQGAQTVLDPLVLQALADATDESGVAWRAAMAARLARARSC